MSDKKIAAAEALLELDFGNAMADAVGRRDGLSKSDVEEAKPVLAAAHKDLMIRREAGELPFYDLPFQTRELRKLRKYADDVRRRVDDFVVLGIGGAALGARAVFKALGPINQNLIEKSQRRFPRLFVVDNIDPESITSILSLVDPRHTVFNVVSKSGSTVETVSQFMVVYDQLRRSLGKSSLNEHIVVTTDPEKGVLRGIAEQMDCETFDIPPGLGGRFSVLSPVGLLPLAVAGVNVAELMRGAAVAADDCTKPAMWSNPAYLFAALTHALRQKKDRSILVMMPYADALSDVADWFGQLWAETLGKEKSLDGSVVRAGQTPVKALGVTDQHSQLQLYLEGPRDKAVVFLTVSQFRVDVKIPNLFKDHKDAAYLGGKSLGELIAAEQEATAKALTEAGQPNINLVLPKITPASIGYLLYFLEVAAAAGAYLYNVNPFDQPAVDESKNYIYGLLGRPGFQSSARENEKQPNAKKKRRAG